MADSIVQGLFGASPYDVEQASNARLFQSADRYAAQAPFERAAGQMYRAGGMFGGAAAQGMGMVNPQVEEARQVQQIMAQIDPNTAEGLTKGALIANQMRNPKLAYLLAQAAQRKKSDEQRLVMDQQKAELGERKQDFQENQMFEMKKAEMEARIRQNDERIADARTNNAERIALQRESNQIKMMLGQMANSIAQQKVTAAPVKLTEGQKSVDRAFGKEYADYQAGGGSADVEKQVRQLDQVAAELEKPGNDYTGPAVGLVNDKVRAFTNPEAVAAKNKVEEVAQRNLRLVLGAQFTQVEGERLIARAYNPSLSPAENASRVKALSTQIKTAAKVKEDAARYFEENGTLTGWKGRMPTLSDFETAIDNATPSRSSSGKIKPQGSWSVVK